MATCTKLSRFLASPNLNPFCGVIMCSAKSNQHHSARQKSSSAENDNNSSNPAIALSSDGSTFLCWHPPKKFPYESTKPVPRFEEAVREGDSALKVQYRWDYHKRQRPSGPTTRELSEMFYTYRWEFRPRPGKYKYRKPNPPRDRDGM
ncbi:39S ribosomal protein L42, mitochondrial-like [Lingula anatina]|uniref:Large ribosomal subunit protein mL42 n=1 Tax=Lingula anatina TaxID=7574 RepID=A0A1S3JU84_LINAN|nr:39S ribosomal protein L42, mitochondrial-like [Lingula anatina]|eukprot:XP_013413656.1 39S ribosomal protein L42, mitochondrial-like [Lingula anatina]